MQTKKHSICGKILSIALAASMLASFGITAVNAAPEDEHSIAVSLEDAVELEFTYEENGDGTITITGVTDDSRSKYSLDSLVIIPDTIDGKTVTKITGFGLEAGIIKLPSTLKQLGEKNGNGVFWYAQLYDNKLPEGLEIIGDKIGISGAANGEKLVMPSTLKYIGDNAFWDSGANVILNEGLEYIGNSAFFSSDESADEVTDEITIPSTVKYIGWDAFTTGLGYAGIWNAPNYVDGFQGNTTFKIYSGGYVEQYMKNYVPHHAEGKPAGYNYTVIGQIDSEPSQTESVNGLKVSGAIPEGAELKAVSTTTKWLEDPLFCYEISLNKDGTEVQPDGYITISIPCEYGNGYVVYIDEETGAMENLSSIYVDGYYVFVTDHLSKYGIKFESEPVKTGESLGDVNGDGSADIADALLVARYDAGLAELSDAQQKAADVNHDNSVDIADALMIARYDAQLIDSF